MRNQHRRVTPGALLPPGRAPAAFSAPCSHCWVLALPRPLPAPLPPLRQAAPHIGPILCTVPFLGEGNGAPMRRAAGHNLGSRVFHVLAGWGLSTWEHPCLPGLRVHITALGAKQEGQDSWHQAQLITEQRRSWCSPRSFLQSSRLQLQGWAPRRHLQWLLSEMGVPL